MRVLLTSFLTLFVFGFTATAAADDQATTYKLDIEAQALPGALKSFAEQTDLQVVYFAAVAEGKDAPALEGEYTANAALDQLLANADLEVQNVDARTYSIAPVSQTTEERGDSDSKNLSPRPVLMAQNQLSQTASTEISSQSSDGGTSIVTGKVTDARTGANLKGAKVTIEETGQWTSTNDLGEFRFVNVPTGSATLTVSYLGYAGQSTGIAVHGDGASQNFALRGGSEIEEIVVFGQRSARALALNQERTADNVATIVSSDLLGTFNGTTVADAIRKAPGVAFTQDFSSGDGVNVIIRGLGPALNTVTLNGVELPVGDGLGRAPDLGGVLADSVELVRINKSLTAAQDSSGSGGLVEIETKGPLDRNRRYVDFAAEHSWNADDLQESLLSGTLSGRMGREDRIGLSLSIQQRDLENLSTVYGSSFEYGQYLPLGPTGLPTITSRSFISPQETFPFETGVDHVYASDLRINQGAIDNSNLTITLTGQAQIQDHTELKLTYQRADLESSSNTASVFIFNPLGYDLRPIQALNGEERFSLGQRSAFGGPGSFYSTIHSYSAQTITSETDVLSLEGHSRSGTFEFDYTVGYTEGTRDRDGFSSTFLGPNSFTADFDSLISNAAIDSVEGRIISLFPRLDGNDGVPLPRLNEAGFNALSDPANYQFSDALRTAESGSTERFVVDLSAKKFFRHPNVEYLQFGMDMERSDFAAATAPENIQYFPDFFGAGPLPADAFDLSFDNNMLAPFGVGNVVWNAADTSSISFLQPLLETFASGSSPSVIRNVVSNVGDFGIDDVNPTTEETEIAPYVQAKLQFGKLDVLAGVRVSMFDIEASRLVYTDLTDENFVFDQAFRLANASFSTESITQTEVLPRILANYRISPNKIIRGGYFRSIARPSIQNISNTTSASIFLVPFFSPTGDRPTIFLRSGNPDLQPAITDSFDLSFEAYDDNAGVVKLGLFYKKISNPLRTEFSSSSDLLSEFSLPDDPRIPPPEDFYVAASKPVNSSFDEEIWGVEVAIEKQFTNLPGAWSGFGAFGNGAWTDGDTGTTVNWLGKPVFDDDGVIVGTEQEDITVSGLSLRQQPEFSGTIGVTYDYRSFNSALTFSHQDRFSTELYSSYGYGGFTEELQTLDFRAEYVFDQRWGTVRLFVEGDDLLRDDDEATIEEGFGGQNGSSDVVSSRSYLGGRSFKIGVRAIF